MAKALIITTNVQVPISKPQPWVWDEEDCKAVHKVKPEQPLLFLLQNRSYSVYLSLEAVFRPNFGVEVVPALKGLPPKNYRQILFWQHLWKINIVFTKRCPPEAERYPWLFPLHSSHPRTGRTISPWSSSSQSLLWYRWATNNYCHQYHQHQWVNFNNNLDSYPRLGSICSITWWNQQTPEIQNMEKIWGLSVPGAQSLTQIYVTTSSTQPSYLQKQWI